MSQPTRGKIPFLGKFSKPITELRDQNVFLRASLRAISDLDERVVSRAISSLRSEEGQQRLEEIASSPQQSEEYFRHVGMLFLQLLSHENLVRSFLAGVVYQIFAVRAVHYLRTCWSAVNSRICTTNELLLFFKVLVELLIVMPEFRNFQLEECNSLVQNFRAAYRSKLEQAQAVELGLDKLSNDMQAFMINADSVLTRAESILRQTRVQQEANAQISRNLKEISLGPETRSNNGPGELSASGDPRHDNDYVNYRDIALLPTELEIYAELPDYLPKDRITGEVVQASGHFLPYGPERLLDSQFRLLRHDFLAQIRDSVRNFLEVMDTELDEGTSYRSYMEETKDRNYLNKFEKALHTSVYTNVEVQDYQFLPREGVRSTYALDLTGVLFDPYRFILSFLQQSLTVPFPEVIAPSQTERENDVFTKPPAPVLVNEPLCCNSKSFAYDMIPLISKGFETKLNMRKFNPTFTTAEDRTRLEDGLKKHSIMDDGQIKALMAALSQQVSVIEGPPGTGKTRLGVEIAKVLFHSYTKTLGPLVCVCYTNHALDQFLNHLLDAGLTDVVRIGSNSKDVRMKELGLNQLLRSQKQVNLNGRQYWELRQALKVLTDESDLLTAMLLNKKPLDWNRVEALLLEDYPHVHNQFSRAEAQYIKRNRDAGKEAEQPNEPNGEWQTVGKNNAPRKEATNDIYVFWVQVIDLETRRNEILVAETELKLYEHMSALYDEENIVEGTGNANSEIDGTGQGQSEMAAEGGTPGILHDYPERKNDSFSAPSGFSASHNDTEVTELLLEEEYEEILDSMQTRNQLQDHLNELKRKMPKTPETLRSAHEILDGREQLFGLCREERNVIDNHFKSRLRLEILTELHRNSIRVRELLEQLEVLESERKRLILRQASVIGVTTTGAAKNFDLLLSVKPAAVICEEAGEVLEAHVLASLHSEVQQLVMIGDHLQLRPKVANYELTIEAGKGYRFNESLFERLVREYPRLYPSAQLTVQRRMRPAISELIRCTLYPELEDGGNTLEFPNVRGMTSNLFFLDHKHAERKPVQDGEADMSKQNAFEADMVEALVVYLLRNGYTGEDITILTPYLGQVAIIREKLRHRCQIVLEDRDVNQLEILSFEMEAEDISTNDEENTEGKTAVLNSLRVSSVDNFQGEESKIIILSLVRNGGEDLSSSIGFVGAENRVNVMLSRAMHGLFILGNADQLCTHSDIWRTVIERLRLTDCIAEFLSIVCQKHPDYVREVNSPESLLRASPAGGCDRYCGERLSCGHACPSFCHQGDSHSNIVCPYPCIKLRETCHHPCQDRCGDKCGRCMVPMGAIDLPCGHVKERGLCFEKTTTELSNFQCTREVTVQLPLCGHSVQVQCCDAKRAKKQGAVSCVWTCDESLDCGHQCQSACGDCKLDNGGVRKHKKCSAQCEAKNLLCGHQCRRPCSAHKSETDEEGFEQRRCPPCSEKCLNICEHSKCRGKCWEVCRSCAMPCKWRCAHQGNCPMPCGAPCSRLPCNQRCSQVLKCGHQCPALCGEKCPSERYCRECSSDEVQAEIVDYVELTKYDELNVTSNPIHVLRCGHIIATSSLDEIMELSEFYERDPQMETFVRPKKIDLSRILSTPRGTCPRCRMPVTNINRYRRASAARMWSQIMRNWKVQSLPKRQAFQRNVKLLSEKLSELSDLSLNDEDTKKECSKLQKSMRRMIRDAIVSNKSFAHPPTLQMYRNCIISIQREGFQGSKDPQLSFEQRIRMSMETQGLLVPSPDYEMTVWWSLMVGELRLHYARFNLSLAEKICSAPFGAKEEKWKPEDLLADSFEMALTACWWLLKVALGRAMEAKYHRDAAYCHIHAAQSYFVLFKIARYWDMAEKQLQKVIDRKREARHEMPEEILAFYTEKTELRGACLKHLHDKYCNGNLSTALKVCPDGYLPTLRGEVEQLQKVLDLKQIDLSISKSEIISLVSLVYSDLSGNGHLYDCLNCGNTFVIANCGAPNQTAVCHCGNRIGGGGAQQISGMDVNAFRISRDFNNGH